MNLGQMSMNRQFPKTSIRTTRHNAKSNPDISIESFHRGRVYQLRFESDAIHRQRWPVSFRGDFETVDGEWTEVFISFSELSQTWRGRRLAGHSLSKDDIRRIAFMLSDGQAGDFALKVAWIHAEYRTQNKL